MSLKINNVQKNVLLAPYTTFRIGGPARYFICAKTKEEIAEAIITAKNLGLPVFILGGGSNILISDNGFPGLVIKIENTKCKKLDDGYFICGAGVNVNWLIFFAKDLGYGGIEFMAGIPGTIGGAVCGNAGAWGRGFGEAVEEVELYQGNKILIVPKSELGFEYRGSRIKKDGSVIVSAKVHLQKKDKGDIEKEVLEIVKKRVEKINIKKPNAGCIFKNIDLKKVKIDKEKVRRALDLSEDEYLKATNHDKLPAGFIIDKLGYRGKIMGGAKIADEHAAFIVNAGGAKAEDVIMLMSFIKTKVRNLLGIQLEEEVQLIGF